jgi:hypothetical protein
MGGKNEKKKIINRKKNSLTETLNFMTSEIK